MHAKSVVLPQACVSVVPSERSVRIKRLFLLITNTSTVLACLCLYTVGHINQDKDMIDKAYTANAIIGLSSKSWSLHNMPVV